MDKKDVSTILEEIGILLELKGENPFKSRAYHNAARIIKGLSEDLSEMVASGAIKQVKGIGPALAEKIAELVTTGGLPYYEQLRAQFPDSMLEMLRVPGLGPKKIKKLYENLGIDSLPALEAACLENRLAVLDGFGQKTQDKILEGIAFIKEHSDRHLFHKALATGERLHEEVKAIPGIIRSQLAGSLRRCKETIKDIDIVASACDEDRETIMHAFTSLPGVKSVVAKGETKSSIITAEGIQADLRLVADAQFPFALHHFTGSREHNTAMRSEARRLGLKMNEYGLFREDDSRLECATEDEIFAVFDMEFIPPELREDRGELEVARQKRLPRLIRKEDLAGILHTHTTFSDGTATLREMALACRDLGMQYLGISDHSQSVYYANGLNLERLEKQGDEIRALNEELQDFHIFHGTECDILTDGRLDYPDDVLFELDFVVISVHSKLNMQEEEATARILKAMAHPAVNILGHPTGRLLLSREGYPLNYNAIFDAAVKYNVAIEINASPYRFDLDWRYAAEARKRGVKLSINPDAHSIAGLQDTFLGVGIARKAWLEPEDVINTYSKDRLEKFFAGQRNRK